MAVLRSCLSDDAIKIIANFDLPETDRTRATVILSRLEAYAVGGLKGGKRGGNRTGTSAAIFGLEAADVGVAYSGEGRGESRGEKIGALGV
ncbi:hypothetical protein FJT64_022860 [Amphibalanus amphitrite]|uniref:Uncharacterized protein n=1 Tax=Amphibalanus amphitrite TaxID=1232801 RepID=A0A6A4WS79_AMPAM|nr:hypothetical protein FJT64_022860 [Amphibalanus amphitrite]